MFTSLPLRMLKWGCWAEQTSFCQERCWGPGNWYGEFGPEGGSVCDTSDIALSPLFISDSSSSAGAGWYGTDLVEALSVCLSPIALLTGVLERVRRDGVHLLLKPHSGRAEYGSWTWFLSSTALHEGFPSGGISSHWQRAWSFTPAWSFGSCGCGPWVGTTNSFWCLNWVCWDHPPI